MFQNKTTKYIVTTFMLILISQLITTLRYNILISNKDKAILKYKKEISSLNNTIDILKIKLDKNTKNKLETTKILDSTNLNDNLKLKNIKKPSKLYNVSNNINLSDYYSKNSTISKEYKTKLINKLKVTAQGRYKNLLQKIECKKDKYLTNQLKYIKNGYYNFGYIPKRTNYCDKKIEISGGYWVYVYPTWYIWKSQILF